MRYLKNNIIKELFWAGIFIGLAFLFRLYDVFVLFLTILLVNFTYVKINKKLFTQNIKSVVFFCSGVIIPIIITSLMLFRIWPRMIKEIIFESFLHATSIHFPYFGNAINYLRMIPMDLKMIMKAKNIFYTLNILFNLAYHSLTFIRYMFLYLLPFLLLGMSIPYMVSKRILRSDKILILLFLLWGILALPKPLSERADIGHLSQVITPLYFLLVFLLQKGIERVNINKLSFIKLILYFSVILILSNVPFRFISRINELARPHYKVSTQHGTLFFNNELDAKSANYVIGFINKNSREQDYIFITADHIPYYVLTNRRNPTYYDTLMDLVYRPSEEKEKNICNSLINKDTKLIIYYPIASYSGLVLKNAAPILEKCIEGNFELMEKYEDYWMYSHKNLN